jgi:thiol-disulfide isomerase/thioredoxin
MKKIIILAAFAALLGSNTYGQGIQFAHGEWKELLAKASREDKLIFVDAYAEWCGPCKKMAKDVFTQKEVGDYYNTRFINVKMDMEKGEGIGLAQKFGITAYPTLLFINEKGDVVHRAVGYHTSDLLLGLGEAALDPARNIGSVKAKYEKGDRSPDLLYNYAMLQYDAMDATYGKTAEEYLATQKDWSSDKNMEFLFQMLNNSDSKMFDYFVEHKAAFEQKFGENSVTGKVDELVQGVVYQAQSEADLKPVDNLYAKMFPARAGELSGRLRIGYYAAKEDWDNYAKATTAFYKKYPAQSWDELNQAAWFFYESVEGKKNLKQALKWALKSVKMESLYYNNDTVAALYYKLGKKGKALKYANKAIALAKETGEDYSSTAMLLDSIKKM